MFSTFFDEASWRLARAHGKAARSEKVQHPRRRVQLVELPPVLRAQPLLQHVLQVVVHHGEGRRRAEGHGVRGSSRLCVHEDFDRT